MQILLTLNFDMKGQLKNMFSMLFFRRLSTWCLFLRVESRSKDSKLFHIFISRGKLNFVSLENELSNILRWISHTKRSYWKQKCQQNMFSFKSRLMCARFNARKTKRNQLSPSVYLFMHKNINFKI